LIFVVLALLLSTDPTSAEESKEDVGNEEENQENEPISAMTWSTA
jgi:hypothetical protein